MIFCHDLFFLLASAEPIITNPEPRYSSRPISSPRIIQLNITPKTG